MSTTPSQYALVADQWPELLGEAMRVEQFALSDPRTACFYTRRTVEVLVDWIYDNDSQLQRPLGYGSLADLIFARPFIDLAGDQMRRFRLLKDLGNKAVHRQEPIRPGDAVTAAKELFQVLRWLVLTYGRNPQSVRGLVFDAAQLPSRDAATAQQAQSREQLEALAEQLTERDQQLREQRLAALASQEELNRLRAEITALRKANEAANQPEPDLSEFDTRSGYIDHYLEEAGWEHGSSCTHEHEVQGMPNATGTGYVDYVLWGDDGKPLGLVEAKRSSRNPMDGQHQAELYANCLEQRYGQRPIIFLSNGYRHRLWDDLRYPPREVQGFYKKEELETLIRRREIRQPLGEAPISALLPAAGDPGHQ
jgi:type I restriction enzyme R subunit